MSSPKVKDFLPTEVNLVTIGTGRKCYLASFHCGHGVTSSQTGIMDFTGFVLCKVRGSGGWGVGSGANYAADSIWFSSGMKKPGSF